MNREKKTKAPNNRDKSRPKTPINLLQSNNPTHLSNPAMNFPNIRTPHKVVPKLTTEARKKFFFFFLERSDVLTIALCARRWRLRPLENREKIPTIAASPLELFLYQVCFAKSRLESRLERSCGRRQGGDPIRLPAPDNSWEGRKGSSAHGWIKGR